ncbi:tyrosine-type recombinase/integrase [Candidatus Cytomitobacter primus]|nr:tyrosine-type recombinase/integrase [Candidatus Cytomitobacter primus]
MNYNNLELFIDFLNEKNLSKNSITAYKRDIQSFCEWKNEKDFHKNILVQYIENCQANKFAQSTLERKVRSINQWIIFQSCEMNMDLDIVVPKIKKEKKNLNIINNDKIADILDQLESENNLFNIRLQAIICMLYSTGLRISELISIKIISVQNVLNEKSKSFNVIGKGMKERQVFMTHNAIQFLKSYMNIRDSSSVYLWNSGEKHITRQSVFLWLQKLGISPHDFRHKLASDLVKKGMNLLEVKAIMGHASIKTTSIYTHAQNSEIEIKKHHPLYKKTED